MPNRIIRDALLDSERYHGVDLRARLAFLELLLNADDFGLLPLSDVFLKRHCTAFDGCSSAVIDTILSSLADVDLLRVYTVSLSASRKDGLPVSGAARYGFIPRFGNRPRSAKPKWPAPPAGLGFNEIKDLPPEMHSGRSADAQQLRTNVAETVFEDEDETVLKTIDLAVDAPFPPGNEPQQPAVVTTQVEPKAIPCPHLGVLNLWAEVLPTMPRHNPDLWTGTRAAHLRARWKETAALKGWKGADDGLAYFRKLFLFVGRSDFLMGRSRPGPNRSAPFEVELSWLVNPQNWAKVHEGKYR
jgi:hypothetical protein